MSLIPELLPASLTKVHTYLKGATTDTDLSLAASSIDPITASAGDPEGAWRYSVGLLPVPPAQEQTTNQHIAAKQDNLHRETTDWHIAAEQGNLTAVVGLMMETQPPRKINVLDERYKTPLMLAAMRGNALMIALLLDAGAKRCKRDYLGFSALDYALVSDNPEAVETLLFYETDSRIYVDLNVEDLLNRRPDISDAMLAPLKQAQIRYQQYAGIVFKATI